MNTGYVVTSAAVVNAHRPFARPPLVRASSSSKPPPAQQHARVGVGGRGALAIHLALPAASRMSRRWLGCRTTSRPPHPMFTPERLCCRSSGGEGDGDGGGGWEWQPRRDDGIAKNNDVKARRGPAGASSSTSEGRGRGRGRGGRDAARGGRGGRGERGGGDGGRRSNSADTSRGGAKGAMTQQGSRELERWGERDPTTDGSEARAERERAWQHASDSQARAWKSATAEPLAASETFRVVDVAKQSSNRDRAGRKNTRTPTAGWGASVRSDDGSSGGDNGDGDSDSGGVRINKCFKDFTSRREADRMVGDGGGFTVHTLNAADPWLENRPVGFNP
jgi:hypothetical protein